MSNLLLILLDASKDYQLGFQDPATSTMVGIVWFHNFIMIFLCGILAMAALVITVSLKEFSFDKLKEIKEEAREKNMLNPYVSHANSIFSHDTTIEVVWTIVPAVLLMIVAVPSFALLYSMEEVVRPDMTLRVVGHQWYWSYEYPEIFDDIAPLEDGGEEYAECKIWYSGKDGGLKDEIDVSRGMKHTYVVKEVEEGYKHFLASVDMTQAPSYGFDSYMLSDDDLGPGMFRLLEVDKRVVLPIKSHIRVLVTSADVLHSWAVPSLGVKVDACPGRINQASLFIKRAGIYYGQCSEICGVNHGFMPIAVRAVSKGEYIRQMNLPRWFSAVDEMPTKASYKSMFVKEL